MNRAQLYAWTLVGATATTIALLVVRGGDVPPVTVFLFWIALVAVVDLLPVSLGYGTEVTMAIPIHFALAILFHDVPWVPMVICGVGAMDLREVRREIPLWRGLFNRSQIMLAVGATCGVFLLLPSGPLHPVPIIVAAVAHLLTNLSLVAIVLHLDRRVPLPSAFRELLPEPAVGFAASYLLLIGLGVVTALAYREIGAWAVAAILIPTLFARVSLLGARAQQQMSERIRAQQRELLLAGEEIFRERERERHRIAEDIHDSSLQMLAAAAYGSGNALELLKQGRVEKVQPILESTVESLNDAIGALRESLRDLKRSAIEEGGLRQTIDNFVDQLSTLWGSEIRIEGEVTHEPPMQVALVAFQIVQEGVVNAFKHADSESVVVRFAENDGRLHLTIVDDGRGFDASQEVGTQHLGLRLMRERASRVGGRLEIESEVGAGTRIEAVLPGGVQGDDQSSHS